MNRGRFEGSGESSLAVCCRRYFRRGSQPELRRWCELLPQHAAPRSPSVEPLRTKCLWTLHASKVVGVERPEHWVVTTSSIARHRRDQIRTQRVRSSLEAASCHQTLNPTYTFFDSNRDTAYSELEAHEAYHKADIFKVTETGLSPDRLLPPEYSTMPWKFAAVAGIDRYTTKALHIRPSQGNKRDPEVRRPKWWARL